jgi:hypothetical protein
VPSFWKFSLFGVGYSVDFIWRSFGSRVKGVLDGLLKLDGESLWMNINRTNKIRSEQNL